MTNFEKNRLFVIAMENGFCGEPEIVQGFQSLINANLLKFLPNKFVHAAIRLIETGYCIRGGE